MLGDVKPFSSIRILVLASEELSENRIISDKHQGVAVVRQLRGLEVPV